MPYGDYAKCPNCGKVVYDKAEIVYANLKVGHHNN